MQFNQSIGVYIMTTYNLNIANISFNSSLDSRDIQKEIDNIQGLENNYESDLESLNDKLNDLQNELYDIENEDDYADKQNDIDNKLEEIAEKESEIQECEFEYNRYAEELAELGALKEEIESNSDEGFEYGIQLIREDDIEDYFHELLIDCGYIPKDIPLWIKIDWQATYDNMKEDYHEIELNGNTFYVR